MNKYNTKSEVWKDIEGYEGHYSISNHGRIRNAKTGRLRTVNPRGDGYCTIVLYKENKAKNLYIHRLVLSHFSDEQENETVNHVDGDKQNNHIDNLEWLSYRDNNIHAIENGLNSSKQRMNNKNSIKVAQYDLGGDLIKEYPSMRQAERETGISASEISAGVKKGWKYGGFIWRLAD